MGKVAVNRRVYFDFEILETVEAGLLLKGTEVKSLRFNKGDISNAYCVRIHDELWLEGFSIPRYQHAGERNHDPKRSKKLLLKKKQIIKFSSFLNEKGISVIPMEVNFNSRGWLKVKLGVGRGKKKYDKRKDIKEKEWNRRKQRLF